MKKWKQVVILAALALGVTFAVKTDADAAGQITGVKQTDAGEQNLRISWDANLGSERYVVEISDDMQSWYQSGDTANTDFYVSGLSAGKSYYVRVMGYSNWNWITDSGTLSTEASEPVEVVTSPKITDFAAEQTDATLDSFSVKLTKDSGANFYQVYLSGSDIPIAESESSTVTVKELTPNTSYWCYSYACRKSASGFIAKGSRAYNSFKTLAKKIPNSNFKVSTAYSSINVYYFSIVDVNNVDGYQLQFLNPDGKVKKTFTQSGSSFRIADFVQGNFYQYRVRTYVQCGTEKVSSAWSSCRYLGVIKKVTTNRGGSALKFNWSKVNGATKYDVYMSTSENSGYKKIKTTNASKRNVSLKKFKGKKIQSGKRYYIKIYTYAKVGGKTIKSPVAWAGYYYRY